MSIEQVNTVDFVSIDDATGDALLTIADHLPWDKDEETHLLLLQDKLNSYLRFIESGEITNRFPQTKGRAIKISLIGQYPLSHGAAIFFEKAKAAVQGAGFSLQFKLHR